MNAAPRSDAMARPIPTPDPDSQTYWNGLREGVLRLQHCLTCGRLNAYHQALCRQCGGTDIELVAAGGHGTVHSFSVVHRAPGPAFRQDAPYAVLLVELDEGPRMVSRLVGADPLTVQFGMRVRLECMPVSAEIALPYFTPIDT